MNHIEGLTLLPGTYPTTQHYPFSLPVLQHDEPLRFDTTVTLFVGENGSGKSTLLEALARACRIHIWQRTDGARYRSSRYDNQLHEHLRVKWSDRRVPGAFFGSETFRDFTGILDQWAASDPGQLDYFGGKSLTTQSHGQSIMSYFRTRYRIEGIYLMDEPETALSPRSQLELLEIIRENARGGHAQFVIATHSPILLACEGATIYSFDGESIQPIAYEETEHYRIYRQFMLDRKSLV